MVKSIIKVMLFLWVSTMYGQTYHATVSQDDVIIAEFKLDTILNRPYWKEGIFLSTTEAFHMSDEERKKRELEIEKIKDDKIHLTNNFTVAYIWSNDYVLRIFCEKANCKNKPESTEHVDLLFALNNKLKLKEPIHIKNYGDRIRSSLHIEVLSSIEVLEVYKGSKLTGCYKVKYIELLRRNNNTGFFLDDFEIITTYGEINYQEYVLYHETIKGQWTDILQKKETIRYNIIESKSYNCFVEYNYMINYQFFVAIDNYTMNFSPFIYPENNNDKINIFQFRYIPGIAFFPDIFKLQSINGKPITNFASVYCKSKHGLTGVSKVLAPGIYHRPQEKFPWEILKGE